MFSVKPTEAKYDSFWVTLDIESFSSFAIPSSIVDDRSCMSSRCCSMRNVSWCDKAILALLEAIFYELERFGFIRD